MGWQGIDIREEGERLVFTASIKDVNGNKVSTGTAKLSILELQSDGSFWWFNFTSNIFVNNTSDNQTANMTHRTYGTDVTVQSGIWTYVLTGLADFNIGGRYIAVVEHSSGVPDFQEREFQYGGGVLADVRRWGNLTTPVSNFIVVFSTDFAAAYDTTNDRWNVNRAQTGARSVTVTVTDTLAVAVPDAVVRLTNGNETYIISTNGSGVAPAQSLNDGTWTVAIAKSGYTFTPTTLVVDGTETPTYQLTAAAISPSTPGLTTGYLTTYSKDGVIEQNVVIYIQAINTGATTGVAIDSELRQGTSDVNGLVEFTNLIRGVSYKIYRGLSPEKAVIVEVPADAGATVALDSLIGKD